MQGGVHDVADHLFIDMPFIFFVPVVFAEVEPGGVCNAGDAEVVGTLANLSDGTPQGRKDPRLETLPALQLHLLDKGMDGTLAGRGLRHVAADELEVVAGGEYDAVLWIGDGPAGFVEVRREFLCSDHIVDPLLQQRPAGGGGLGKGGPDVGDNIGHQGHVGLVHHERHLAGHGVHHPDHPRGDNPFGLTGGAGHLGDNHVRIDAVHPKLHLVHVLLLQLGDLIVGHRPSRFEVR